jgi:hypothetical protein
MILYDHCIFHISCVSYEWCLLCVFVTWFFTTCKCSFAQMNPLQPALYSHIVRYSSSQTNFTTFIMNKLFGITACICHKFWKRYIQILVLGKILICIVSFIKQFPSAMHHQVFGFQLYLVGGDWWKWMSVVRLCVLATDAVDMVHCNFQVL